MKKQAARLAAGFFVLMAALTIISWKLEEVRTPRVLCVQPEIAALPDENGVEQVFPCVLPRDALRWDGQSWYIYQVYESSSFFSPLVARRQEVMVTAETGTQAAVSGVLGSTPQIVRYESRPLMGENVKVSLEKEREGD